MGVRVEPYADLMGFGPTNIRPEGPARRQIQCCPVP